MDGQDEQRHRGGFGTRLFEYIKFKRVNALPTWQAESHGQVRYNSTNNVLAVGGPTAWADIVDVSTAQTLTNKTLTTPTIADLTNATHTHLSNAEGGQVANYFTLGPVYENDMPADATTQMSAIFANTASAINLDTGEFYMPVAGEIVGIYAMVDANRTAGTATFTSYVNGTSFGFDGGAVCVIDATNTRRHSIHVGTGLGHDFAAGDRIGIQCVTSGWTPTNGDATAWIVVRLDL